MERNEIKPFKLIRSMKFGLILLGLLGGLSVFGSIIPQGRDLVFYQRQYSEMKYNLITNFNLNDIYHSWYFVTLFSLLCINLMLCSITRLDSVIKKIKALPPMTQEDSIETITFKEIQDQEGYINNLFEKSGFKNVSKIERDGRLIYFSKKFSGGYLGSWLIHLGFLLIVVFYGYGQYTHFSTAVYGVPGSTMEVEGTEYHVAFDGFRVDYRDDGSVDQYYTDMRLLRGEEEDVVATQQVFVNNPLSYQGYNFYQSATGWAASLKLQKDDKMVEDLIYEGTVFIDEDEEIALQFNKFYPDFIATERGIFSKSHETNNPMFLYALFFNGRRVDMNVVAPGDIIQWEDYQITLDQPQMYTYLQVNKMKGKIGAIIGSILVMVGLFLAFYLKPVALVVKTDKNKLHIYGKDIEKYYGGSYSSKNLEV